MEKIQYSWCPGTMCNDEIVAECSLLYSNNYGYWSDNNPNGLSGRVKLSKERIYEMLSHYDTDLYYALNSEHSIVGYAIALRKKIKGYGVFSWVTQLVVHENYRHRGIAKNLLFSIWGLSNDYAWGIITSNPYAVRALEKATRRRSIPVRIKKNIKKIMSVGSENINYIKNVTEYIVDTDNSKVNTNFFVDHAGLTEKMFNVISEETPWLLGELNDGWEWAAFTFNDQEQISLNQEEIFNMLNTSDDIVKLAYSRMSISDSHKWTLHTNQEVSYIEEESSMLPGQTIIDFGCGQGRHSLRFCEMGYNVFSVDYVEKNIQQIQLKSRFLNGKINAVVGDCRYITLHEKADVAICLYDVIGSFSNEKDNLMIIKNIFNHLKKGGIAFISVMNYELTNSIAKHKFKLDVNPNELLRLTASNTMEKTGDIFDPDLFLVDDSNHLVYRREQFSAGRELPVELVVRDKRYSRKEIMELCKSVGFLVEYANYVSAKDWKCHLESTNPHAKEILLKCIKP